MKYFLLILLAVLAVGGFICENSSENDEFLTRKSPVLSISVKSITSQKVSFLAKARWNNGCGRFSHFTPYRSGNSYFITVHGKEPKGAVCTQALISFDAPVEISFERGGLYNFRFWQTDTSFVDTTLSIP